MRNEQAAYLEELTGRSRQEVPFQLTERSARI